MTDGNKEGPGTVAELRALLAEAEEDTDWYADGLPEEVKTCGVWTQDGDGVCKTWGNVAHGATAGGRARLISALRNAAPLLLDIAEAAESFCAMAPPWGHAEGPGRLARLRDALSAVGCFPPRVR